MLILSCFYGYAKSRNALDLNINWPQKNTVFNSTIPHISRNMLLGRAIATDLAIQTSLKISGGIADFFGAKLPDIVAIEAGFRGIEHFKAD